MEALTRGAALHDLGWMRRVAARGEDPFRSLRRTVTNSVNDLFPNTGCMDSGVECARAHTGRPDGVAGRRGAFTAAAQVCGCHGSKDRARKRLADGDAICWGMGAGDWRLRPTSSKLMAHLDQFIIMDDVELVPLGQEQVGEAGSMTRGGP